MSAGLVSKALGVIRWYIVSLRPRLDVAGAGRLDGIPVLRIARGARLELAARVRLFPRVGIYLEQDGAVVTIGSHTFLNRRTEIICAQSVSIGESCAIAWDVTISDTDNHLIHGNVRTSPVVIGDRVWIGQGATVMKGVTIGAGAVVAARSVVTKDVPPRAVVVGVPARVVREGVTWEL